MYPAARLQIPYRGMGGQKGACVRIACVGGGPAGLYASVLISARTGNFTIGMGTTLAIGDVIALADNLEGLGGQPTDVDAALTRYEDRRRAEIAPDPHRGTLQRAVVREHSRPAKPVQDAG